MGEWTISDWLMILVATALTVRIYRLARRFYWLLYLIRYSGLDELEVIKCNSGELAEKVREKILEKGILANYALRRFTDKLISLKLIDAISDDELNFRAEYFNLLDLPNPRTFRNFLNSKKTRIPDFEFEKLITDYINIYRECKLFWHANITWPNLL